MTYWAFQDQCEDLMIELFVDYYELRKQAKYKIQVVLNQMKL